VQSSTTRAYLSASFTKGRCIKRFHKALSYVAAFVVVQLNAKPATRLLFAADTKSRTPNAFFCAFN